MSVPYPQIGPYCEAQSHVSCDQLFTEGFGVPPKDDPSQYDINMYPRDRTGLANRIGRPCTSADAMRLQWTIRNELQARLDAVSDNPPVEEPTPPAHEPGQGFMANKSQPARR